MVNKGCPKIDKSECLPVEIAPAAVWSQVPTQNDWLTNNVFEPQLGQW